MSWEGTTPWGSLLFQKHRLGYPHIDTSRRVPDELRFNTQTLDKTLLNEACNR